jgi:hypothetical protein
MGQYGLGRAREGLDMRGGKDALRGVSRREKNAAADPLVEDARRRVR